MSRLFHYTTPERAHQIRADKQLRPGGPLNVVWLTTLQIPSIPGLQISAQHTERFAIEPTRYTKLWLQEQKNYPLEVWVHMELAPGAQPGTWYISAQPVSALPAPLPPEVIAKLYRP